MGMGVARLAIWILNIVVCLGYLVLWILMPTTTYRQKWRPKLREDLDSTFFGTQGPNLLLYTFPVLFIAVTGSIYLHLGKNSSSSYNDTERKEEKRRLLAKWGQPILVRGPLGIVSWIESTFLVMFIVLLVWSLAMYLYVGITQSSGGGGHGGAGRNAEKPWISQLKSASLRFGLVGNIGLALLFFPVARGSSILGFFGLTSEGSIKYHIWLGHIVMLLFTAHGLGYIISWAAAGRISKMLGWKKTGVANLAGEISLLAGLILWATTYQKIRRKFFELFFYTHYLYIIFVVFFIFHVGIAYASMMLPGFYLFMIDRYLRFLQSRQSIRLVSSRILPSCNTLELNFFKSRNLKYTATSILFVNVPSISKLQWHPFTISSSSKLETDKVSVIIKVDGSWTNKLYQMVGSNSPKIDRLQVSTEGPYGPASTHFLRHDSLVMVSGGSGITPFFSIIREMIYYKRTLNHQKTPKLFLICAFKKSSELPTLDLLLPIDSSNLSTNLDLRIEAYITSENKNQQVVSNIKDQVQHIWFKPNTIDVPLSPVLGSNGMLWLAAIISSSFIGYLLSMGILTRYYIYPNDSHDRGHEGFNLSVRSCLHILLICVFISVSCSIAFIWNKKRNAMEDKQIMNIAGITSSTALSPFEYNGIERELESLPRESIVEVTNVHYGQRPDLKSILSNCQGSSVGVLVCGPKKLRHDVAAICSGVADNLHFESLSFSW